MPLLIAGGGKRMLTLAAREADIVGLLPHMVEGGFAEGEDGVDAFAAKATSVREMAGDRAGTIEFNILIQMLEVTNDREAAVARLKSAHDIDNDDWFDSPMVYVGSADEICEKMRAMREQIGISYFVAFETAMEECAPIVKALAGT